MDVIERLHTTLAKDWTSPRSSIPNSENDAFHVTALAETDTHTDDHLRPRTPQESAALLAYFRGELEIDHPPNFLKATMPVIQRAMVEQFHEAHVEYSLTALTPPQVKLWKNMTHGALFAELQNANRDEVNGEAMLNRMKRDIKMLHYDGIQTLRFVFHSKRIAKFYQGVTLRLQRTTIVVEDADFRRENQSPGCYDVAQVRRLYSLRVFGTDKIGLVTLIAAFSQLSGVQVLDIQRARVTDTQMGQKEKKREDSQGQPTKTRRTQHKKVSASHQTNSRQGFVQRTMRDFAGSATPKANVAETATEKVEEKAISAANVPASPGSDEEFTMGAAHTGSSEGDRDLPIQLMQWLESFNGKQVEVDANGQCAMLAFYASTKNHDGVSLPKSAQVTRGANRLKRFVYAIMLSNLRNDVELGIVDPISELTRLYPDREHTESVAAATASLFTHYVTERDRSVSSRVASRFWAGTHELRAMAQYLREPLLVLDVNEHNDVHIQRYMYKEYRLADGTDHESGYVEALTDRAARDYLYECWRLHVMPTFLILHHQNRHFSGVQHGELLLRWNAEGDPGYAAMLDSTYEWRNTVNILSNGEDIDLSEINVLERNDAIDAVMTKKLPMNERLRIVLTRLGLPILDMHELDERKLDENIVEEERLIHESYGIDGYASGSQVIPKETSISNDWTEHPKRAPRVATGTAVEAAYSRILGMADVREVESTDRPTYDLICAANREAFTRWTNLYRAKFSIPLMKRTQTMSETIRSWLLEHHQVLRHLFAYLPYPELEAKCWSRKDLLAWGEIEAYHEQTRARTNHRWP
ncbi:hypothetical protein PHMEG_00010842 [Phytophthora megakarya]|uniref:Uncharacterized protein n=1 Tax=Phytophthora megakarya TaxID=4795 RepID=A0A225WF55_9STRA|nr:hypothetical protein PHMEG_00010842 [Phytophthora megakarya]